MLLTARLGLRKPENNDGFGQNDFNFNSDELDKLGCAVRLRHSGLQSIPNAALTLLAWDTEDVDTDVMHNPAANTRITFTTPGLYAVGFVTDFYNNATGWREGRIRHNGGGTYLATTMLPNNGASQDAIFPVTTLYRFAALDFIEAMVYQNSGGALNFNNGYPVSFWAFRVGA